MNKYILILITTFNLGIAYGQNVGIGLDENLDPQERLHVKKMEVKGLIHYQKPDGTIVKSGDPTTFLVSQGNEGIAWEPVDGVFDFENSTLIKNKIIRSNSNGITIGYSNNTNPDKLGDAFTYGSSASDKQWKLLNNTANLDLNPLVSKVRFTSEKSSINATLQTMVLKYSDESDQTIVSFTCGLFIKEANNHTISDFRLFHVRPEVITGPRNSFKVFTMSGMIKRESGINKIGTLKLDTDYYITVACRGRNIGNADNRELIIGKAITSGYSADTRSILTESNVTTSFTVEQVEE